MRLARQRPPVTSVCRGPLPGQLYALEACALYGTLSNGGLYETVTLEKSRHLRGLKTITLGDFSDVSILRLRARRHNVTYR